MTPLTTSAFFISLTSSIIFAILTLIMFIKIVKLKEFSTGSGVNLKSIKNLASRTAHSSLSACVEEHEEAEFPLVVEGSPPPPFVPGPPAGYIKPLPYVTVKGKEPKLPVSIFHTRAFWIVGGAAGVLVGVLSYFFIFT